MPSSSPDDFDSLAASSAETEMPAEEISGANRAQRAALEHQGLNGARWFYWIAGLSLVNSAILLGGGDKTFAVGMGTTYVVGGLAEAVAQRHAEIATIARAVGFGINFFLAAFVALFGWLCGRRYSAAFIIGMGLYLLDGLILVPFQAWMSVAFHGFALYCIGSGLLAFRKLNALEAESIWADEGQLAPAAE